MTTQKVKQQNKSKNKLQKFLQEYFLAAAIASMGASLTLKLMDQSKTALFVGQWAAPFLLLGIYNKLVKLEGHDKSDKNPN
ncbi:hypothetical protein BH23BAC2_BH23BAC2_26470 [soil metagenome]